MKIILHLFRILSVLSAVIVFSALNIANFAAVAGDETGHGSDPQNLVVVELFTSQGCSSCPPADKILAEFSQDETLLALSYSVDYWNYLGWKDTFAQPDCVARQRNYNHALGKSGVYTPQMVIQGARDIIGSHGRKAKELIQDARQNAQKNNSTSPKLSFVPMTTDDGDMIDLKINAGTSHQNATIWVIGYDFVKTVNIKGGELKGQMRKYHNVVQSIKRIGSWMGEEVKLTLSKKDIGGNHYDAYAVLLQQDETGPIIAAAKLK